jgi:hypothetical protein
VINYAGMVLQIPTSEGKSYHFDKVDFTKKSDENIL